MLDCNIFLSYVATVGWTDQAIDAISMDLYYHIYTSHDKQVHDNFDINQYISMYLSYSDHRGKISWISQNENQIYFCGSGRFARVCVYVHNVTSCADLPGNPPPPAKIFGYTVYMCVWMHVCMYVCKHVCIAILSGRSCCVKDSKSLRFWFQIADSCWIWRAGLWLALYPVVFPCPVPASAG